MKTMSKDTFIIEKPEYLSDSGWEALCEAIELYVEEWEEDEEYEDEDEEDE
jgi:hypothetical protein